MEHITLFTDILPEEQERMRVCFKVREAVFQNGEMIMEYSSSMKKIGLIQEGRAVLYCCDEDGNEYVIDELNQDSVFGEPFLLPSDAQHYYVCAATQTKVLFIDYEQALRERLPPSQPDGQQSSADDRTSVQTADGSDLHAVQIQYEKEADGVSAFSGGGEAHRQTEASDVIYGLGPVPQRGPKRHDA